MTNTIVCIPCLNEEKNIGRTIKLIRGTGFNGTILVIDDGSTDKTSKVAKENGAEVIKMPKNVGKAAATFAAFKEGIKRNASALITFDADMQKIPKRDFEILENEAKKATEANKIMMTMAYVSERSAFKYLSADITGVRSYSRNALLKVMGSKYKGKVKGFGIEQFLNMELGAKGHCIGFHSNFEAGEALRMGDRQSKEINLTLKRLKKRMQEINKIRMEQIKEKWRKRALEPKPPMDPQTKALLRKLKKMGAKVQIPRRVKI
jgi:glycosyltransferase involved in cell wall biosynthesis